MPVRGAPRPPRESAPPQLAQPYAPPAPVATPAPVPAAAPVPEARPVASTESRPPVVSDAARAEQQRAQRQKADANWVPRLIAPVEGASAPAPAPVVSAPAPKKPADDFVPRLISPAPEGPKQDDNGNHTP
jgi:hypothetical protein